MADPTTLQGGWDAVGGGGLQPSVTLATCLGQWLLRSVVSDAGAGLPQHVEAPGPCLRGPRRMHPEEPGAGLYPVLAAPPGLGGRLTLPRPAAILWARGP